MTPHTGEYVGPTVAAVSPRVRPAVHPLLRWFAGDWLPPHLQAVVAPFAALAVELARAEPSAEQTVAIRKLLESKDAAVRAAVQRAEG